MIIVGDTVGIKPLGVNQGLRRQGGVKHAHRTRDFSQQLPVLLIVDRNRNVIDSFRKILWQIDLDPKRLRLAVRQRNGVRIDQRAQQIGISSRLCDFFFKDDKDDGFTQKPR